MNRGKRNAGRARMAAAAIAAGLPLLAQAVRMDTELVCEYGQYGYINVQGEYVVQGVHHCTPMYFVPDEASTQIPVPFIDGLAGNGLYGRRNEPWDSNGDGLVDCFKSVVAGGNYSLSGGKKYGWRTLNGQPDFHGGVDIPAPVGSVIRNAQDGRVAESGTDDKNGNFIRIYHSDGTETVYIHMKEPSKAEHNTMLVAGAYIGQVGLTGQTYGPHLHFQIWTNRHQDTRKEQSDTKDPTTKFHFDC